MRARTRCGWIVAALSACLLSSPSLLAAGRRRPVDEPTVVPTFNREVVRIFQEHCQVCHHPGGTGPFSLMDYETAATWSSRVLAMTQSRVMPPWKPAYGCGSFKGNRSLTAAEIRTLYRWVEAGAPEGHPADAPPPLEFPDGWRLGSPIWS